MGIPVTRVDPPKPGFVRLKESFGTVRFERREIDIASLSAMVGDQHCGVEIHAPSDGPGPGDFKALLFVDMLRAFADRIEKLAGEQ